MLKCKRHAQAPHRYNSRRFRSRLHWKYASGYSRNFGKTHNKADPTNENIYVMMEAKRGDLIMVHSHPESIPPSLADFRLCLVRSVRYGIIAGHDGSVYRYRITDRSRFHQAIKDRTANELDGFILRNVLYHGAKQETAIYQKR